MIRRHAAVFQFALVVADALVALGVLLGASQVRFGAPWQGVSTVDDGVPAAEFVTAFIAGWIATLWLSGAYELRTRWTFRGRVRDVGRAAAAFTALAIAVLFFLQLTDVSRLYLLVLFPLLALATLGVRVAGRGGLLLLREMGYATRYMLILGANADAEAFAALIEAHHELNIRVVGHLATDDAGDVSRPVLGRLDDLERVLHSRIVDEVAMCLPADEEEYVQAAIRLCEQEGKTARIPAAPIERTYASAAVEELDGLLIYSVVNTPDRLLALACKRLIDVAVAAMLLFVLAPALGLVALLLRVEGAAPVLVRDERVGRHGRAFEAVRFRSAHDPAASRVAAFLGRTSLDRLPLLWNVLRGQMSLIGPRPPLPSEVAGYATWHRRRLSMRPGLIGVAGLGHRRVDPDRAAQADIAYIDRWSPWLDVRIVFRTVAVAVLGRTG